ncbi:hypothetical protein EHI8A_018920 [Entamoeba histolytica HM-1:IMSS-B]|uniref:Transmembrane protein n=6 Tax=Entamoeba histolytica TaxID=5759 RepID=B1N4L5_ENTH1|nr:hypothetical protein EHI_129370 [Entamoeba histolytica HM-1:IMSS]EMD43978.1 Hypothetical protein EHI5A_042160 [Entamoeba histolytica KU27]EMH72657.1 hypothetical protein EHI8A_018920 [Entamoeba histolytica HM-1:IMSS-B]EMS13436.1 hypothetical protein KM1_218870 [Entamoeba histolytica HM-3:IMSS]ENY63065.1 hypothetical protein EHI7A_021960 [Entamoeba histolytica HM-1:IMSS-A]GAT98529.1 hypothetical protein CL6EHI_129370 [Entamoeba histolytica]|eukprot:XP_001914131.1 hypothetical protein EHI_129370 [Entamoeba histolytica HM-1:IMSS]
MEGSITSSSSTTSIGLPVVVESIISTTCLFSSIFIYFFEQANVYCRALALQNVFVFYILFTIFILILTSTLTWGGIWEFIMFAYLILCLIIKLVMIASAIIFSKSEKFLGIPPISTFILNKASAI